MRKQLSKKAAAQVLLLLLGAQGMDAGAEVVREWLRRRGEEGSE